MALGVDGEGGREASWGVGILRGRGQTPAFHTSRPVASEGQTLLGETWAEPTDYRGWEVTAVVSDVVGSD